MNAEQMAAAIVADVREWIMHLGLTSNDEAAGYVRGVEAGANRMLKRLREAGIDLDHAYDRVTPEHEAGRLHSAPAVLVDDVWLPVFVRRPLEDQ